MSDHLQEMDFGDCTLAEVAVKISGNTYFLREASGEAAVAWRNARTNAIVVKDGQPAGAKDIASIDPLLVSRCLYNPDNKRVPLEIILAWPDRVQRGLFARLKQISNLSEAGEGVEALKKQREMIDDQIKKIEDEAKNSSETTEDGST